MRPARASTSTATASSTLTDNPRENMQITLNDHLEGRVATLRCGPRALLGAVFAPQANHPKRWERLLKWGASPAQAYNIIYNPDGFHIAPDQRDEGPTSVLLDNLWEPGMDLLYRDLMAVARPGCKGPAKALKMFPELEQQLALYLSPDVIAKACRAGLDVDYVVSCGIIEWSTAMRETFKRAGCADIYDYATGDRYRPTEVGPAARA
jgi:hypothetical protein